MLNWASGAFSSTSVERDHRMLEKVQSLLKNIEDLLETENFREFTEETLHSLTEQVREIIKAIRSIPDKNVHLYLLSREAILRTLRSAVVELNLALDQLTSEGRTPGFYKNLLAFQEYFEKALEQMLELTNEDNRREQSFSQSTRGKQSVRVPINIYFVQLKKYKEKLIDAHHSLLYTYRLLNQEEICLDQWIRATNVLETMSSAVRELCKVLDNFMAIHIFTDTALSSSQLIVALYYTDEQIHKLISLISVIHSTHRSKPRQTVRLRQEIHSKLDSLTQSCDDIIQKLQRLTFM